MHRIGLVLLGLLSATTAAADVTRCAGADADVRYNDTAFAEMDGDTGWVPSGSPAQVRITGKIAGETTVAMGLHPTACWPQGLTISAPGRAGTGVLDFAYGAELHVFAQIHTSVLGHSINWSGEIPVPILPTDLMLANTQAFDPALLPGSGADHVSGSDTTSTIKVLSTDVIGDYIGIPGISGGLHLDVTGAMTTTYRTTAIVAADGSIATDGASTTLAAPIAGFGPALDLPVAAQGTVSYAPALIFTIAFDVKILGIRVANWSLASVTMNPPSIDTPITLAGNGAHIPLPKANALAGSRLDFSAAPSQALAITNTGEGTVMIEATTLPAGVTVQPLSVPPGQAGSLAVALADGVDSAELVLATNDPSQPTVSVQLGRDIGGTGTGTGTDDVGHSGCNTGGGGGLLLVGLVVVGVRRRRRI
jgi:MYXO-CTERM domain-containing protein